ncbi:MAG TPA: hypothetical protein VKC17_01225 [Sphingomicrobium sp.]|nr:hypothetical protein [Sphingomicrobium sp.]
MNWGILIPIAAVIIGPIAWVVTTWIRARHGYPINDGKRLVHPGNPEAERQIDVLSTENAGLKSQVLSLESRLAVLERIATDPAERVSLEIEHLR